MINCCLGERGTAHPLSDSIMINGRANRDIISTPDYPGVPHYRNAVESLNRGVQMRPIIAGIMTVGIAFFIVGIGTFFVHHWDARALNETTDVGLIEHRESLNERALQGLYLGAAGASVTIFMIMIDEERMAEERRKERGFFF
jgi:hypothetical protein